MVPRIEMALKAFLAFLVRSKLLYCSPIFANNILKSSSTSFQTDVIHLDFKKAFDSVAHNELLLKLWHIGILGNG